MATACICLLQQAKQVSTSFPEKARFCFEAKSTVYRDNTLEPLVLPMCGHAALLSLKRFYSQFHIMALTNSNYRSNDRQDVKKVQGISGTTLKVVGDANQDSSMGSLFLLLGTPPSYCFMSSLKVTSAWPLMPAS